MRATRILAGRGYRVPALQRVAWFGGLALMGVALLSAGGLMLAIDFAVMVGALIFFFLRAASDADRAEAAVEQPRDLTPAVRGAEVGLG